MNNKVRSFLLIPSIFLIWLILDIVLSMTKDYDIDFDKHTEYEYLLTDSLIPNEYNSTGYSWVHNSNFYNYLWYPNGLSTIIWEFKGLKHLDLQNIFIHEDVNLSRTSIKKGQFLDSGSKTPIHINLPLKIDSTIHLNLNERCSIFELINGENYIGFSGLISKMSLENSEGNEQIIFLNYDGLKPTVLIFFKGYESFYILIVQSESVDVKLDSSVLKYFNLKEKKGKASS